MILIGHERGGSAVVRRRIITIISRSNEIRGNVIPITGVGIAYIKRTSQVEVIVTILESFLFDLTFLITRHFATIDQDLPCESEYIQQFDVRFRGCDWRGITGSVLYVNCLRTIISPEVKLSDLEKL